MKKRIRWWMRILCLFQIHWYGRTNGGGMGDAIQCDVCGCDHYGPGWVVHDRAKRR